MQAAQRTASRVLPYPMESAHTHTEQGEGGALPGCPIVRVVGDDDCVVPRSSGEGATIAHTVLDIANNGSLRHGPKW